jgi:hypothetical protein
MRGVQDMRRPLYYVLGANVLSAVLCPVLVYPVGLGLEGSAIANATAQTLSGVLFLRAIARERVPLRPDPRVLRNQLVMGRDLLLRGLAMQGSFFSATVVAASFGPAAVAGHQIALQLWMFCALVQDAVAIAAQSLVGAELGGGRAGAARWVARRVSAVGVATGIGFAVLIGAGAAVLPGLFTSDEQVIHQALLAWPWFVAMQPVAGPGVRAGRGAARRRRHAVPSQHHHRVGVRRVPARCPAGRPPGPGAGRCVGGARAVHRGPRRGNAGAGALRPLGPGGRHALTLWSTARRAVTCHPSGPPPRRAATCRRAGGTGRMAGLPAVGRGGIVVVDKPPGMTSHDVVARVRRLARTRRVGHGGTLDPMATGVLVIGVERATRLLTYVIAPGSGTRRRSGSGSRRSPTTPRAT